MNNKLATEIIADIIDSACTPLVVGGAVYKEWRGTVALDREALEALAFVKRGLCCKDVAIGSHDCNVTTKAGFTCDRCLEGEAMRLNNDGIKTIGSCCGHGKLQGYIQVSPAHVEDMKAKQYEQLPTDVDGNGLWCFEPKTLL